MKTILNKFITLSFVTMVLAVFISCEEKDDYDYDSIYPVIMKVSGSEIPMQGRHYLYSATIRGGSTFDWSSSQNAEIIDINSQGNYSVHVYFPDVISTTDNSEIINVTETTLGGVDSETYEFEIDSVTPFAALPIKGSNLVNAGFDIGYSVAPSATDKIYSTYKWESNIGEIEQSATEPWKMSIFFNNEEVGIAEIALIEQTTKGMADTSYLEVIVNSYCPLENWTEDLIGVWSGTDGFVDTEDLYPSEIVTSDPAENSISLYGLNFGWILDWWGEEVVDGGTIDLIINNDGTVLIESQYLFTTDYSGDLYEYWVVGSGRWNNCGLYPELTIEYTVTNKTDGYDLPYYIYNYYFGTESEVFTATLVLDGGEVL